MGLIHLKTTWDRLDIRCLGVVAKKEEIIPHRLQRLQMCRVEGFKRHALSHEATSHTLEALKAAEVR